MATKRRRSSTIPLGLPPVLADPPWLRSEGRPVPVVATGIDLSAAPRPVIHWEPGEREALLDVPDVPTLFDGEDEAKLLARLDHLDARHSAGIFLLDKLGDRAALEVWNGRAIAWCYVGPDSLPALLARFGLDGLPGLLRYAELDPHQAIDTLMRIEAPAVAPLMAGWFARRTRVRTLAQRWLVRYPEAALGGLIPAAVGRPGEAREAAGNAVRFLAARQPGLVADAAQRFGPEAAEAVNAIVAAELLDLPAKIPRLPRWLNHRTVPAPVLAEGRVPLSPDAIRHLATMLCFSPVDPPYAGLRQVAATCDPSSLTELVWSIFCAWREAGASPTGYWAVYALGHLGGDEALRRLAGVAHQLSPARAEVALEAFAVRGTDRSLMYLQRLASRGRSTRLRNAARQTIERIAELRGLTEEELADRLVPDLELEPDGSCTLDYGARQFRVEFDARLAPLLVDLEGKPLRGLPRPRSTDDQALAREAGRRYKALKKDLGTLAGTQVNRLERAMCLRHAWSAETFRDCLLGHPLLVHLVRRLVWLRVPDHRSFRVVVRTPVDPDGELVELSEGAEVSLAHPLLLTEELWARWNAIFAEARVEQPFPQLEREAFLPSDEERGARRLQRFEGREVAAVRLLGLDFRGWEKSVGQGRIDGYRKPLRGGAWVHLPFAPGLPLDRPASAPGQALGAAALGGVESFGQLDVVDFSEVVRDIVQL
jgi:hypothetical protein